MRKVWKYTSRHVFLDDSGNKLYADCDCEYKPEKGEADKNKKKKSKKYYKINSCKMSSRS